MDENPNRSPSLDINSELRIKNRRRKRISLISAVVLSLAVCTAYWLVRKSLLPNLNEWLFGP